MATSGTPIQPGRSGPEPSAPQGSFQGTVTGLKSENGVQTVEIQSAQGRIRLQAEGDFQVGEKLRVFMSQGGGGVRLEKAASPAGMPQADWQGAGYQMAGDIDTLKNVRAFEEQLVNWVARRQPGAGGGAGAGAEAGTGKAGFAAMNGSATAGGLAAALGGGAEAEALLRLPLPELLKRVLAREGGRDFLMQALSTVGKEAFASLMAGMEEGPGGAGGSPDSGKASLLALLRSLGREIEAGRSGADKAMASAGGMGSMAGMPRGAASGPSLDMGAFWPGGPGGTAKAGEAGGAGMPAGGAASTGANVGANTGVNPGAGQAADPKALLPWMGRVLDRTDLGGNLAFAGGKPIPNMPMARGGGADPMFRYLLDLGARTLEVQNAQVPLKEAGDFVDFEMENSGAARLQARFLDPLQSLPPGLRQAHSTAASEGKAALQVAARYLEGFRGEPYHEQLVKDFAEVLAQSGRLAQPPGGQALRAGQMPGPKELDNLLRLFVAFPRDAEQPERQARTWSEAARDPRAMLEFLRALKPERDTSLLRSGTALRLAGPPNPTLPPETGLPGRLGPPGLPEPAGGALPGGRDEDALAAVLRKILPEGFKSSDVLDLARQLATSDPSKPAGPEAKSAQFLLQAFTGLVPREDELREGKPNPFYFYHNQEWKGLQVTWEQERKSDGRPRREANGPIKMRVETQAQHMGKVDVGVMLQGDKAILDFRNQFHDVGELLAECLPELQKSLALLDVHIEGWTYSRLQDIPMVPPTAGWVRPASLDGGNLDLTG